MRCMDVCEEPGDSGDDVAGPHGGNSIELVVAARHLDVGDDRLGGAAHPLDERTRFHREDQVVAGALHHQERRRISVDLREGRGTLVERRVVGERRLDDEPLDEAHLAGRVQAQAVGEVVRSIERYARPDRCRLPRALRVIVIVGGEGGQRGEVPASRAAGDGDEVGITAVLRDVVADPSQRRSDVDQLVGPRCVPADAVVDADAHPSTGGHVGHQRPRLEAAIAGDPSATMDLHQHRAVPLLSDRPVQVELELHDQQRCNTRRRRLVPRPGRDTTPTTATRPMTAARTVRHDVLRERRLAHRVRWL